MFATKQNNKVLSKDPNFIGQPIFSQLLFLIDKKSVHALARAHQSDRYTKKFNTYNHLVTMLYCIFHNCTSLREVTSGMQACYHRLNHLGLAYCARRSTLSDANRKRTSKVFEAIYMHLYKKFGSRLSDSLNEKEKLKTKLYIADSTTISLFKEILKNAGRTPADGKRKGGMKVHMLSKADEDVPCLVRMNAAASHDVGFIQNLKLSRGSIIVFDKAYLDYTQYDLWTQEGISWVTRLRDSASYTTEDDFTLSDNQLKQGILSDQFIILGHTTHKNVTRTKARLITFYSGEKNKIFRFITNNLIFDPLTICRIYKYRWQIELLFKRIKHPSRPFIRC